VLQFLNIRVYIKLMPKHFRFLLITAIILLVFVGVSSFYLFKISNTCRIQIISEPDAPRIKIVDKKLWNSFLAVFTACEKGVYQVYNLKSESSNVKKITYILVSNETNLLSFANLQTEKIFFKWKNEINSVDNSAKVSIYIPDSGSADFEQRLLSAIIHTTKLLFIDRNGNLPPADLSNFNSLNKIGLTYEL
jgi:hypothetical protein